MKAPNKREMRKAGLTIAPIGELEDEWTLLLNEMTAYEYHEYNQNKKRVKTMEKNKKIAHLDTGMKGAAVGLLTYVGVQQGWSAELIAALVPVASVVLSFVSSKIGDKNTTLLLKLAVQAVEAAPVKKVAKKAPVKKAK